MEMTISLFKPRQRLFDPYRSPTLIEGAGYSVTKGRRLCEMSLLDDSGVPKVGVRWSNALSRSQELPAARLCVCVVACGSQKIGVRDLELSRWIGFL